MGAWGGPRRRVYGLLCAGALGGIALALVAGPGRGIGLQIIVLGVLTAATSIAAFFVRRIRRGELGLPDAAPNA